MAVVKRGGVAIANLDQEVAPLSNRVAFEKLSLLDSK